MGCMRGGSGSAIFTVAAVTEGCGAAGRVESWGEPAATVGGLLPSYTGTAGGWPDRVPMEW